MNSEAHNTDNSVTGGEPRAGRASGPVVILFVLLALAGYGSANYVEHFGGGYNPGVPEAYPSHAYLKKFPPYGEAVGPIASGKKVYETYCQICHQATGLGLPGQFPPLAGSEWVLPEKPDRIIRIVLNGLAGPIEVNGAQFNGAMFAFKDMPLTDEDIANVLSYIRNTWGNKASEVTADQVKAIRGDVSGRGTPWSAPELLNIPVE